MPRLDLNIDTLNDCDSAQLIAQIELDSELICSRTKIGEAWDDPEEWMAEAARLAHCIVIVRRRGFMNDQVHRNGKS